VVNERIVGMKYKPKKRYKKKWIHLKRHTEIEVVSVEEN
jgi:ribosomal protein L21